MPARIGEFTGGQLVSLRFASDAELPALARKVLDEKLSERKVELYLIIQNRLYRGEIPHKGNSHPGEHPAIVEKPLWDDVQAVLAANRVERATGARARHPSLLTGMVFDETSQRLTPTYAVKKGTRYRYYVSTSLLTGAGRNHSSGRRIYRPTIWKAW